MTQRFTIVAVVLFLCAALAAGSQSALAKGSHGMLKLKPNDVMVNTSVEVKGAGFARKASITLRECSRTFWIVPEQPCNTGNEVTVQTNAHGGFTTSIKAEVCPEGEAGKAITERKCYIGVAKFGEDTVELSPSAKLIVTYP
jgi:hypothetical protein